MTDPATWFARQFFHQHEPEAKPAEQLWRSFSRWDAERRGWRYYAQHVETGEVIETDEIGCEL